jgi:hypothetical protein
MMAIPDGELITRCDICREPFRAIIQKGKLLDPKDNMRPVPTEKGFAHASCRVRDLPE